MRGRTVRRALIYNGETKVTPENIEMNHRFAHDKLEAPRNFLT